jgi:catechol 2,3-dioxygenase-like lactoylglutathione lyase family enzyme
MSITETITFLHCSDLGATHAFYSELLGLRLVVDQGHCRVYRVNDQGFVGFCERGAPASTEPIILTFVTDDVDGWAQRIEQAGFELEVAPRHNPTYGIVQLFVRDPDGYLVELQRFDDPDWASVIDPATLERVDLSATAAGNGD